MNWSMPFSGLPADDAEEDDEDGVGGQDAARSMSPDEYPLAVEAGGRCRRRCCRILLISLLIPFYRSIYRSVDLSIYLSIDRSMNTIYTI
jgi:hypothetical protein